MKSARFIATISLLCLSFHARACIVYTYAPSEYYLFHLVGLPDDTPETFNPNSEENCRLWQQQTSPEIPLDDIYQVVYKFDIESITALKSGIIPEAAKSNQMAQWLVDHDDQEALDFLLLAKNCEWLRLERQSPWYYPSKNDPVRFSLNEVADRAMSQREPRFAGRYALQAVRALISLGRYDDCIRYWSDVEATLPDGLMRQMTLPYIGGAYLHVGNTEEAKRHFIMANDLTNLIACDQHYHNDMNRVEKMELLYESYPDCPEFRTMLWKILGHIEPDRDWGTKWQWDNGEQDDLIRLALLCDKVIQGDKAADKALWAYAATYIAHLQGDDIKADRYMKIAEKTVKDQPLEDAVKVMRMYLDAQLCTYDKAYEQRLFGQLQWLQDMLEKHIDDENIRSTNNIYDLKFCRSYYYWSDAMRCILLGTVCPKMLKSGKTTLALQLANMADYALLNEINAVEITCWDDDFVKRHGDFVKRYGDTHITLTLDEFRHYDWLNNYDYGTHFAAMMDTLSANEIADYAKIAEKPRTAFDRFLNAHSYVELDFLNEIIGTHCLREMRYADAERYLSKVSAAYHTRTNVYKKGYLNRDPFSLENRAWSHATDAKLHFARTMRRMEQDIAATAEPNQKALLMIEFGMGIRNSFDYCWALTHYQYGDVWSSLDRDWSEDTSTRNAQRRADVMIQTALASFTDDECAAQAQYRFSNFKTVMERYPYTPTAYDLRGRCDNYRDYHAEKKAVHFAG